MPSGFPSGPFIIFNNKMKGEPKKLTQLYFKADEQFLQLSAYFKKLMHDHRKNNWISKDQKKILKLFNFNHWDDFMHWVNQKLEEGGEQVEDNQKNILPEIIEEEADLEESLSEDLHSDKNIKCQLLAIENAKIRKENIILQDKIENLQKELMSSSRPQ